LEKYDFDGYVLTERQEKMLANNFKYHPPVGNQAKRYEALREKALELATLIYLTSPENREQSLAITNIEQAVMWVNAAISRGE